MSFTSQKELARLLENKINEVLQETDLAGKKNLKRSRKAAEKLAEKILRKVEKAEKKAVNAEAKRSGGNKKAKKEKKSDNDSQAAPPQLSPVPVEEAGKTMGEA